MNLETGRFFLAAWSWINCWSSWSLINILKPILLPLLILQSCSLPRDFMCLKEYLKPFAMVVLSSLSTFLPCKLPALQGDWEIKWGSPRSGLACSQLWVNGGCYLHGWHLENHLGMWSGLLECERPSLLLMAPRFYPHGAQLSHGGWECEAGRFQPLWSLPFSNFLQEDLTMHLSQQASPLVRKPHDGPFSSLIIWQAHSRYTINKSMHQWVSTGNRGVNEAGISPALTKLMV